MKSTRSRIVVIAGVQVMGFPTELIYTGDGGLHLWRQLESGEIHMWPEVWRSEDGTQRYRQHRTR
jgi:hypothetical protein